MEPVTTHISQVKGFMNIQADSSDLMGTTSDSPDSAYGCVNSTYSVRFANMVISPTTASNVYTHKYAHVITTLVTIVA